MLQLVLDALEVLRSPFVLYESDLHAEVGKRLRDAGLPCEHEVRIGKGCRIDYMVGGVGIEIKKGKPSSAELMRQLSRYAACEGVEALVVLTQRSIRLPDRVGGKPLRQLSLNRLWGVALP